RSAPAVTTEEGLRLGGAAERWGWGALQGALDDFRLWSVARTAAQIAAARHAALTGTEAGLSLYLKMDEASGATTLAGSGPGAVGATVEDRNDGLPGVITGRVATPGAVDRYTFTLADDAWLLFDSLTDNSELTVTLRGPGGLGFSRPLRNDAAEFGSANPLFFAKPGTYTITVDAAGDRQHPYAFRLIDLRSAARAVAFGETVTGTLSPGQATQAFAFEAAVGDHLYIDLLAWSRPASHGTVRLFDPSGRQILYGDVRDQPTQTLALSGRYVLVLEGRVWDATPADYSFRLQRVADESTAITLGVNPAPGPLWTEGRFGGGLQFTGIDALSVPAAALELRDSVTVEAWVRPDRYADSWTPIVYEGSGTPQGRTYSLWLGTDGAVHLSTADAARLQRVTTAAGQVPVGRWSHVAGVIDRANGRMRVLVDGVERASVAIRAGQAVSATAPLLIGHAPETQATYDLFVGRIDEVRLWSVARSNAEIAAAKDAPLSGPQPGLVLRLPLDESSGRSASDASGGGRHAALVSFAPDGVTGRIDHPGQRDRYTFTLAAETKLLLDSLTSENQLRFDLTGPRGVEASDWPFNSADGATYSGSRLLVLPPGTYTAVVRANGDWTGWYSFRLVDLGEASPIAKNSVQRGLLEPGATTRLLSFEAAAGERIFLDDDGFTGSISVRLFDPDGQMLFGPTPLGSLRDLGVRRLDRAGTYVLAVEGYPEDGTAQSWSLIVQTVADETRALTLGAVVNGAIDHRGQVDRYTFTLAGETAVVMDVRNDQPGLRWSLEGGGLAYVTDRPWQASDSEHLPSSSAILLPAGSYVLSVRGVSDTVAPYAFRLFALGSGSALALDETVSGTLDPASATAVYSFSATAFERVWFDRESLSAGSPKVRIFDAAGRQIFGLADFQDSAPFVLPMTGTYTLLVEGRRFETGTINFGFALRREVSPVAGGATAQTFEGGAGQLPYALGNWQGPPAGLLTEGGNTVLRLTSATVGAHRNSVGFPITAPGPYQTLETTFKARITPASAGRDRSGDGMAFALLPLRLYGAGGRAPDFSEEPNLAGALGIGFDIVNNGEPSGSNNHVSLHFDGRQLAEVAIPLATLDLASGQFFTVRVLVERAAGGSRVTLTLTPPGGGAAITPFDRVFVGGLELETSRVAFAARNGGRSAHHDLDDVQVTTTAAPAGASSAVAFSLGSATGSAEMLAATGLSSLPVGHVWRHAVTVAEAKTVVLDWMDTGWQPIWTLRGPDGVMIASRRADQTDGTGGFDVGPFRFSPGTYEIAVTGLPSPTASYRFRLLDLAEAVPLTLGARVDGSLNPGNETDLYRFSAAAGDRVFFAHLAGGGGASWRLFDPDGAIVAARNGFAADRGPFRLGKTGTYVLAVEGEYWQGATTSYAFVLNRVTDDTATLPLGERINGEIAHAGQVDRYTFTLTEAKTLYLDSLKDARGLLFRLEGPNGAVFGPRDLGSTDAFWEGAAFRAGPGAWTLAVFGSGGETGAYAVRLLDLSSGTIHTPGTPSSGTLDPGNETDVWRFSGTAGQRLFIDAQQAPAASWRLLDPWGRTLFGPESVADRGILTLPASGLYTLLVEGYPWNSGSLSYRFNLQPVSDTAEPAVLGALTAGEIAHAGQARRYTFTLPVETRLFLDTLRNEVDVSFWEEGLRWTLSGPGGVVAERSWNRGNGGVFGDGNPLLTLPAGQYTLTVRATSDRTGAFSFRLLDGAAATAITLGSPVSGTLSPGQESDLYRFTAAAGDRFYFDSQQAGSWNTFWRLIGPHGEVVFAQGLGADRDTTTLAESGTYLLIIDGHPADVANVAYRFAVYPNPVQAPVRIGFLDDRPAPDLVVETIAVAPVGTDTILSGGAIRVSWQLRNAGTAAAEGAWSDRVIVRRVDTGEILATTTLPYAPGAGGLAAGGVVARQATLTLPEGNRGAGSLIVQVTADVTNALEESNRSGTAEQNNGGERAFTSELAPYADVTVTGLAVAPSAGWAPGDAVVVSWTTRNNGTRPITTALSERLTVRNLITGQQVALATLTLPASEASPFSPGEARARTVTVTWPAGLSASGRFEFAVLTDATDAVAEANPAGTGEANNVVSTTITSAPDLVVADLAVVPAAPLSGDVPTITWHDRNLGNAPTPQGWVDRVRVVNTTTNRVLADIAVPYDQSALGVLGPGGAVARSATVTLPAGIAGAGTLSITVTADLAPNGTTQIVEANAIGTGETNNAASLVVESRLRPYADLVATTLTAPASARGEAPITVGWTITNEGAAATDAAAWMDAVILSRDEVIGNADDIVLGRLSRTGPLGPGARYDAELTVTLPGRLEGGFFLAVRADDGNAVSEPDTRANNTSAVRPIALSSPFADLAV
ncbi:MAG: hypothetical protein NZ523_00395, partial [Elioraea sp.]|nr:hypothetical protein [Elioraea sp.]